MPTTNNTNMNDEDFQNYEIQRKAIQASEKREYYKNNKEKITARRKIAAEHIRSEWISAAKDKEAFTIKYDEFIKKKNDAKKIKMKEYRQANKEKISENVKKYQEANKEKIKTRKSEKVTCECGSVFGKDTRKKHERTIKHCNYIKNKEA